MAGVIEVEGLDKTYRRFRRGPVKAVDGLHLSVPDGGVFGFLGPNGSGKTTTIRCLLGLVAPSAGQCSVLGASVPDGLAGVVGRIGSIVETPTFFPNFSGQRNLAILAHVAGIDRPAVERALDRVGLAERARDRVRTYSLGMRQRLGIAAALMKDPQLLILDEPANGLDPAGIREVRDLVRSLGDEGRTVFISSHILSEIQQTCDRVAILNRGRCVAAGTVDEVVKAGRADRLVVKLADLDRGADVLRRAGLVVTPYHDHVRVDAPAGGAAEVTRTLAAADLWVEELRPVEVTLEEVFLELTGDGRSEPPAPPPPPPSVQALAPPPPETGSIP